MFNKVYEIKYSDTDELMRLKPSVFLEFMEDIAAKNADALKFGYDEIYTKNYGWFLLKYAIEIDEYLVKLSSIKIETEPRGTNKLFVYRDFYFYNENDKLIGKATSMWALMDLTTKSMLKPKEILQDKIWDFEKRDTDMSYNKIPAMGNADFEKTFEIRYDDIDVNRHVNNAKYIMWALETMPVEFLKEKSLKRLDINYKKDITYGNSVHSSMQIQDNKTIHSIKNAQTNEDLCTLLLEWK